MANITRKWHKFMAVGCSHGNHIDPVAAAAVVKFRESWKPTTVVHLGDFVDTAAFRKGARGGSDESEPVGPDIDAGCKFLQQLRPTIVLNGNHECFDDQTEAMTKHGWVKFQDLKGTDLVGSYNIHNDTIEFHEPIKIHSYDYDGPMFAIKNRNSDLVVTPNHRLYYKLNGNEYQLGAAEDLKINGGRMWFKTCAPSGAKEDYPISDDMLKLCAWVLTDGNISRKYGYVTITQRPEKVGQITEILDRIGISYKESQRQRDITHVCGRELLKKPKPECLIALGAENSRLLHEYCRDKDTFPDWVMELSARQFAMFLDVYIEADGSRHKSATETSWMLYGTKVFMDGMHVACVANGYRSSLTTYRGNQYRLNINSYRRETSFPERDKHITFPHYTGKVYCVTTVNDTVVVRRNGKVCITGNCRLWNLQDDRNAIVADCAMNIVSRLQKQMKALKADYEEKWSIRSYRMLGNYKLMHGYIFNENSARDMAETEGNIIFAHTHRPGMAKGRRSDNPTGYSVGTLSNIPNMDYANARRATHAWAGGFCWGEYCDDRTMVWLHEQPQTETEWRLPI